MSDSNKNTEYNDELKRQNQQQEEQSEGGTPSTGDSSHVAEQQPVMR